MSGSTLGKACLRPRPRSGWGGTSGAKTICPGDDFRAVRHATVEREKRCIEDEDARWGHAACLRSDFGRQVESPASSGINGTPFPWGEATFAKPPFSSEGRLFARGGARRQKLETCSFPMIFERCISTVRTLKPSANATSCSGALQRRRPERPIPRRDNSKNALCVLYRAVLGVSCCELVWLRD